MLRPAGTGAPCKMMSDCINQTVEAAYSDFGFDFALILANHDEVGDLFMVRLVLGLKVSLLTFSASDQAAPLAPVLLDVVCSVSDILAEILPTAIGIVRVFWEDELASEYAVDVLKKSGRGKNWS
jgi:hypothetical protein